MNDVVLVCCGQPFAVQAKEPHSTGGWVLSKSLSDLVRFCPFCGRKLTLLAGDSAIVTNVSGVVTNDHIPQGETRHIEP